MEIKIIREEHIKPEIPTPPHLRSYKLSLLDQLNDHVQVPIVYFYPNSDQTTHSHITSKLALMRKSLSKTLVHFYPFAGKLSGDSLFVDSNDGGAHYVEAEIVDCTLHQILSPPDMVLVRQLIPHQDVFAPPRYVLMVRVNVFKCGGIAVTYACSHRVVDGSAMLLFMEAWVATARGLAEPPVPRFSASSLFPQDPLLPKDSNLCPWVTFLRIEKCVTRRFVFDSLALRKLRTRASSSTFVQRPSRFDVIVAFIWGCAMAASRQRNGSKRPSIFSYAFDLRGGRLGPLLSNKAFGNLILQIPVVCNADDSIELQRLVGLLKEAKLKINEYTSKIGDNKSYKEFCGAFSNQNAESTDFFFCSSVLNRGVYGADFGWGKPKWACPGSLDCPQLKNLIFLVETASGDGIEVWLTMEEKDMGLLEKNPELLAFASVNPCPDLCDNKAPPVVPLSASNRIRSAL